MQCAGRPFFDTLTKLNFLTSKTEELNQPNLPINSSTNQLNQLINQTPAMNVQKEVLAAEGRIRPHIRETILDYSPYYSEITGANISLQTLKEIL